MLCQEPEYCTSPPYLMMGTYLCLLPCIEAVHGSKPHLSCRARPIPLHRLSRRLDFSLTMISNLGVTTLVLSWVFTPISIIAVALHLFCRLHVNHVVGLDDCLLLVASLATLILVIMITWAITDEGADQHLVKVSSSRLALISHVGILKSDMLMTFLTLKKVSICQRVHVGRHKYAAPNIDPDLLKADLLQHERDTLLYLGNDSALFHPWGRNSFGEFSYLPPFSGRVEPQDRRQLPRADHFVYRSRSHRTSA